MRVLRIALVSVLAVCIFGTFSMAQDVTKGKKEMKGASERAMERASDQAIFHRASDWFATVGKSEGEKAKILAERKAKRAAAKAKKMAEKAERKAKKAGKKAEKKARKKMKEAGGEMDKVNKKLKGSKKNKKAPWNR